MKTKTVPKGGSINPSLREVSPGRMLLRQFLMSGALSLLLLLGSVNLFSQSFTNPIYDLADPHIFYYNGYYYATGTTGSSVKLKKAPTLESLKSTAGVTVFSSGLGGPCCDYWAPEIHRLNDIWYIYYTAKETSTDHQSIWVLENTASDPTTGTWVNRGRIFDPSTDYWAIDGTILSLNGTNYLLWSGIANASDGDKPQRIYIGKMTNPWTLAPGRVLLSSPTLSWEKNGTVNEAPEVLQKNGKVFLVYSANGCWTPDYILGMLSMDESADPMIASSWTKSPDPVFRRNDAVQAYAPGHHCFFKSPDGTEDWFAYHATIESAGACNSTRMPRAQKISWNQDGTPNFGIPLATGIKIKAPSGEPNVASKLPVANGVYKIVVKASGQVLDIAGCNQGKGAFIQQDIENGLDCQKWNIQATESGYYVISCVSGGLVISVLDCSTGNGANMQSWAATGSNCQQWNIMDVGGGYYQIKSRNSSKSLQVDLSTNILQQYDYQGNSNQQFQLVSMEVPGNITQAEDASYSGPDFKNANAGYHGTGYLDYANASGDYITWTVNVPATGNYNLDFRYAQASGSRPLELKVNGSVVVSSLDFPSTGSWTAWVNKNTIQHLNAGNNTVTLTAIGSSGPNMDELVVSDVQTSTGKNELTSFDGIFTFPNPVKNILYVKGLSKEADLRIFSLAGQLLLEERGKEVNVSSLTSGAYILKVQQNDIVKSFLIRVE